MTDLKNYPRHARAIEYARHCIGVRESPLGSNRGGVQVSRPSGGVDFFEAHDFVAGAGYPWCVTLFLTAWAEAGHTLPYLSPSAHAFGDWARRHGWAVRIHDLIPGDGCDWAIGAGHFSMFESYDAARGIVHTIDGNWNNRVQRVAHPISSLRTAVHVPETHKAPKAKKPRWVIATDHKGKRVLLYTGRTTEAWLLKHILPRLIKKYGRAGITVTRGK